MSRRRTPAPDIAACVLLLFAATLVVATMKALYMRPAVRALLQGGICLGLLGGCAAVARGLLLRRPWSLPAGLVLLLAAVAAAVAGFHMPETAELPAGLLGLLGAVLLVGSRGEFSAS
ncbi:MAG: hypothetical protein RMK29_14500 [Myxococcales bacterium]|nr:hypothetical protein [Myxococcota bacterium]MDW8282922.1 hypothetical protein [Myxococcales bacterium]